MRAKKKTSNERAIVADVLELSTGRVRLFRNNVGAFKDAKGRWVKFGLCVGSSDIIGLKSITITPQMVGQKVAVFVALECKDQGLLTEEQTNFLRQVQMMGGLGAVVCSKGDAELLLCNLVGG